MFHVTTLTKSAWPTPCNTFRLAPGLKLGLCALYTVTMRQTHFQNLQYILPQAKNRAALQPLFKKYKVDVYNAGHVHSYGETVFASGSRDYDSPHIPTLTESTWPVCDFTNGSLCNGKQDFVVSVGRAFLRLLGIVSNLVRTSV